METKVTTRFRKMLTGPCVYRFYDPTDHALLYVGVTNGLTYRLIYHAERSPFFFPGETVVEVTEYETYREAAEAEREAITQEHPRWNVQNRDHWGHPDGMARGYATIAALHPGTYRVIWSAPWSRADGVPSCECEVPA